MGVGKTKTDQSAGKVIPKIPAQVPGKAVKRSRTKPGKDTQTTSYRLAANRSNQDVAITITSSGRLLSSTGQIQTRPVTNIELITIPATLQQAAEVIARTRGKSDTDGNLINGAYQLAMKTVFGDIVVKHWNCSPTCTIGIKAKFPF